jgi:hypothetical protein
MCVLLLCFLTGTEPQRMANYIQHLRAICWMGHRMDDMERLWRQLPNSPCWQLPIRLTSTRWKEQLEAELPLWVPLEKSLASIVCSTRHSGRGYIAISLRHLPQACWFSVVTAPLENKHRAISIGIPSVLCIHPAFLFTHGHHIGTSACRTPLPVSRLHKLPPPLHDRSASPHLVSVALYIVIFRTCV